MVDFGEVQPAYLHNLIAFWEQGKRHDEEEEEGVGGDYGALGSSPPGYTHSHQHYSLNQNKKNENHDYCRKTQAVKAELTVLYYSIKRHLQPQNKQNEP